MEFKEFIIVVKEFEIEVGFADILYLEAIKKLENVRGDLEELKPIIARRIIKPFLATWGRMGRNVEREDFDWKGLVKNIRMQKENLDELKGETLLKIVFDHRTSDLIRKIYNGIEVRHLGATGISKILHLLNPELFVMWDERIRKQIRKDKVFRGSAEGYLEFLKWMQKELDGATKGHSIDEIWREIDGEYIDRKTLPKLADEYCWWKVRL